MNRLKAITGITWALLCLILVLVLFPGLKGLSVSFSKLPFMKLNPNYSGGEISGTIQAEAYVIEVHKPVFDGLAGERKHGFVQVAWRGQLPAYLCDTIDYDSDGRADFVFSLDRDHNRGRLSPLDGRVEKLIASTSTSYGWAVRVGLRRELPPL